MIRYLIVQCLCILNYKYATRNELQQDVIRYCHNRLVKGSIRKTIKRLLLKSPTFGIVYHKRIKSYNRYFGKLTSILVSFQTDCHLDVKEIGEGFVIHHGNGSVIHAEKIGKNCSIFQQVTLGKGKEINSRNIPIIGDNVNICAGAIVIGGINIGNNVTIGAGTVVTKDVPDNCTVVGSSFRIIPRNE